MKCPGKVYWNVLHSNLPDIWKMFATVLVLRDGFKFEICKVGKSLSTSILTSEALLLHASYIGRRKYLGIFGRWRQTTFVHFAIKLNVSRFENNSHDLFLWYFGNTVPTSVPDMSTQNIWYRILELSLSSKAQNYL